MKGRVGAMEAIGALMVLGLVAVAVAAPLLAPHDPTRAVAPTYGEPAPPVSRFHSAPICWAATCFPASSMVRASR